MKIILKITSLLIFIIFVIIAILSYGISTDKFNNKIISQVEQKVPKSKIIKSSKTKKNDNNKCKDSLGKTSNFK